MTVVRRLLVAVVATVLLACQPGGSVTSGPAAPSASGAAGVNGERLIDAFLRLVKADAFTATTEMSGVLTAGALQLGLAATGTLRGGDGTMSLKLNTVSDNIEFDAIFVGEFGYIRVPDGEWQRVPREEVNTSGARLDSFSFITSGDQLRYDGTDTHRGVAVHVLVNTEPLPLGDATAGEAAGEATKLRILVQADGTPVFLSYHMTVTIDSADGQRVSARGDIEQSFTGVGEPIIIEPPPGFPD